jgi:hypothetical protein
MRALRICLWVGGIFCFLLSMFGLCLPVSVLESVANYFGTRTFIIYGIRTASAAFVGMGTISIVLALNPMKYGAIVPVLGISSIFIGVVCVVTGLTVGMPIIWLLGDSLFCALLGALVFLFWQKAKKHTGA